jgi:hypothetical protein
LKNGRTPARPDSTGFSQSRLRDWPQSMPLDDTRLWDGARG